MTGRRLTLASLAADLGVSRSTISNAYNHPDQLSPALRDRILLRAAELGFAGPDPMARGLRRGRVGAVGVLVNQGLSYAFSDPTAIEFLDGLARQLQPEGLGVLLHSGPAEGSDLRYLADAAVDAWVIQSLAEGQPAVAAVRARSRPLVVLDQPALPGVPVVGIDDVGGARAAVGHLLGLGHRRLAVLAMPLQPDGTAGAADLARQEATTYQVVARRLAGAAEAAASGGVSWAEVPVMECATNDPDAGEQGAAALLRRRHPPTAIFALSDQLALGALRAARAAAVAVPDQLSIVGFDDSPLARTADPPLTTVAQGMKDRGQMVGQLLLALLRGEQPPSPPLGPVHLVVRASTAPPPVMTR